jgi:hypothetical protein
VNKTVAIVGTAGSTRDLAPYQNNSIDIWMFNAQVLADWAKRVDLIIEVHKPETFMLVSTIYTQWLKANTNIPVYMQDVHPDVTASVKFPLQEIVDKYCSKFERGTKGKITYFTSSVCYAIALAIYMGYERIEMYGVDMANNTEYIYQRDGIALWFGIAIGLGIEVYIPRDCAMFADTSYGADSQDDVLSREEFERIASELQPLVEETFGALKKAEGTVDGILGELEALKAAGNVPPEKLDEVGARYSIAMNEHMQCIADYASMSSQYRLARQLQQKVERQMEAAGKAQMIHALKQEWKP